MDADKLADFGTIKTAYGNVEDKELPTVMQKELLDTIKLIKFRIVKDNFQKTLKEDISNIK